MTRVLVAAASAVTRAGLEAILAREPAFTVVGDATIATLAEDVAEHGPDVVLVELGGQSNAHAVSLLRPLALDADEGALLAPAIVLLTDDDDSVPMVELLQSGVRAMLSRDAGASEIVAAIGAASAGLVVFAAEWGAALRSAWRTERRAATTTPNDDVDQPLTTRELEVLRLLAEGLANKQIAARLTISEHTVKFHVGSVFTKIGASTRAEAVMIGARRGLIVL